MDGDYFKSYENLSSHDVMLKDKRRLKFYREFCDFCGGKFVKDKTVLDLGCGTGILALYCAKNGAKKVYAVEASDVAILSRRIVEENGLENVIEVIQQKIEHVNLPNKVDIIISEWMGFYLVHECMLSSLIVARDKFLKADGIVFPNRATLFAAPVSLPAYIESNFNMYDTVDGFSFENMKALLWAERLKSPLCETISPDSILSFAAHVVNWNLSSLDQSSIEGISQAIKFDINCSATLHAVSFWFTVGFEHEQLSSLLDTSPYHPETHWKQTTVFLPKFTKVEPSDKLVVDIQLEQSPGNPRWYEITLCQKTLLNKSYSFVSRNVIGSSDPIDVDEYEEENKMEEEDDLLSVLIGALSEQYDTEPSEIAKVIAENNAIEDIVE